MAAVVVGHQPLELVVGGFEGVVRAMAYRLPVGIDSRQEIAETVGNGGRALVRQEN